MTFPKSPIFAQCFSIFSWPVPVAFASAFMTSFSEMPIFLSSQAGKTAPLMRLMVASASSAVLIVLRMPWRMWVFSRRLGVCSRCS